MKEAEERAMVSSAVANRTTKKAVKLSLQELHRLPSPGVQLCTYMGVWMWIPGYILGLTHESLMGSSCHIIGRRGLVKIPTYTYLAIASLASYLAIYLPLPSYLVYLWHQLMVLITHFMVHFPGHFYYSFHVTYHQVQVMTSSFVVSHV